MWRLNTAWCKIYRSPGTRTPNVSRDCFPFPMARVGRKNWVNKFHMCRSINLKPPFNAALVFTIDWETRLTWFHTPLCYSTKVTCKQFIYMWFSPMLWLNFTILSKHHDCRKGNKQHIKTGLLSREQKILFYCVYRHRHTGFLRHIHSTKDGNIQKCLHFYK